jgi:hypothetical protein
MPPEMQPRNATKEMLPKMLPKNATKKVHI